MATADALYMGGSRPNAATLRLLTG